MSALAAEAGGRVFGNEALLSFVAAHGDIHLKPPQQHNTKFQFALSFRSQRRHALVSLRKCRVRPKLQLSFLFGEFYAVDSVT